VSRLPAQPPVAAPSGPPHPRPVGGPAAGGAGPRGRHRPQAPRDWRHRPGPPWTGIATRRLPAI